MAIQPLNNVYQFVNHNRYFEMNLLTAKTAAPYSRQTAKPNTDSSDSPAISAVANKARNIVRQASLRGVLE